MKIIPQISKYLQEILISEADNLATETGFVKRSSKMTGALFAQTLIFGWLSKPDSTLEELSQVAMSLGLKISAQGIEQRFNQEASELLKRLLEKVVSKLVSSDKLSLKIFNKFSSVHILDSSIISLPKQLKELWKGCGGNKGTNSALKIGVRIDLINGELNGPFLEHGKGSDKGSLIDKDVPKPGGLRIADLGYFSVEKLKEIDENNSFFLSRWHVQSNLYSNEHEKIDLVELLKNKTVLEMDVLLSAKKLPVRLIAIKVSESEVKNRKAKIQEESRKNRRPVNTLREQLIEFNIYLTNVPETLLTFKEVIVLMKSRWQIELLFKLWKSEGKIDEWRTTKPLRILSEVYAKLMVMVIQHWLILISCWKDFERSLTKAVKIIQKNISILIYDFNKKQFYNIEQSLEHISTLFESGTKLNKRGKKPSTAQLLNNPESLNYFLA
jgi:hypothetical protein